MTVYVYFFTRQFYFANFENQTDFVYILEVELDIDERKYKAVRATQNPIIKLFISILDQIT